MDRTHLQMKEKSINRPKKWLPYEIIHPARLLEVRSFSRLQTDSIFQQVKKSKLVIKKYGAYDVLEAKQKKGKNKLKTLCRTACFAGVCYCYGIVMVVLAAQQICHVYGADANAVLLVNYVRIR